MWDPDVLVKKLSALGHPTRLKIVTELTNGEMYLSEIAKNVGISRALAKIHLIKLRKADLVETKVVVMEEEARALRFYKLKDFEIHISNEILAKERKKVG